MNPDVMTVANGKWPSILLALGFTELAVSGKHGPCPMCEGKDRFRLIEKAGRAAWICNQCGSGDGMNLVETTFNLNFQQAADKVRPHVGGASYSEAPKKYNPEATKRQLKGLMNTWRAAKRNEIYPEYLERRQLPRAAYSGADLRGAVIKHFNSETKENSEVPAMLARIITPKNRTVCLHRTYIYDEGTEKKITKTVGTWTGGGVRLFKTVDETALIVAEGIETALAARWLYFLQHKVKLPCWATVSANGMKKLAVPKNIEHVLIMGDNDASYTGQLASYELANRLVVRQKIGASVFVPNVVGEDWLDVLQRKLANG